MSSNVLSSEEQQGHIITDFPYRLAGEPETVPMSIPEPVHDELVAASDAAAAERQAFERGYREGEAAAIAAAESRLAPARERLEDSIRQIASLKEYLYRQGEEELVQLSISIASKIVRREIALDQSIVATLVRISLEKISQSSKATVRLNPGDYEYFQGQTEGRESGFGAGVELVEDISVESGGCVVETDVGDVDGQIDVQLQEIAENLLSTF